MCSPSDLCSSKKWGPLQFCDGLPAFACFRPAVLPPHALPARLISPIFASFLRDIDVTDLGPCPAEGEAIAGLVGTMPCAFSSEVERVRAFTNVLDRYLGCKLTSLKPDAASSSASADACIVGGDNAYLQILLEAKNELGSADPWFQGQRHYQLFWDAHHRRRMREIDPCPALFLELVGPNLRVSALASLESNRVVCEPLTSFLPLLALTGQPRYLVRLAATLRAVRNALGALIEHAQQVDTRVRASQPAESARRALPYPLRDHGRFPFVEPLLSGGKLLYKATEALSSGEQRSVCVKFVLTRPYPSHVHSAWADVGLAPKLFSCETLPDGDGVASMLVMELLAPPEWVCLAAMPRDLRNRIRPVALNALQERPRGAAGRAAVRSVRCSLPQAHEVRPPQSPAGRMRTDWALRAPGTFTAMRGT